MVGQAIEEYAANCVKPSRPAIVTVLSVLFLLFGILWILGILLGIYALMSLRSLSGGPADSSIQSLAAGILSHSFLIGLVPVLLIILIGIGLWKQKKWAWTGSIIILAIFLFVGEFPLISDIKLAAAAGLVYMLSADARKSFGLSKAQETNPVKNKHPPALVLIFSIFLISVGTISVTTFLVDISSHLHFTAISPLDPLITYMVLITAFGEVIFGIGLWKMRKWAWKGSVLILCIDLALLIVNMSRGFSFIWIFVPHVITTAAFLYVSLKDLRRELEIPADAYASGKKIVLGILVLGITVACVTFAFRPIDMITDPNEKDDYYTKASLDSGDPTSCEKIFNSMSGNDCYKNLALLKQEPSLCAKIKYSQEKDICYKELSAIKSDRSLCSNIEDENYRELCGYRADRDRGCLEEGEGGVYLIPPSGYKSVENSDKPKCCEGLKKIPTAYTIDSKGCEPAKGYQEFVCVGCGDGKCDRSENYCYCPEDCGKDKI